MLGKGCLFQLCFEDGVTHRSPSGQQQATEDKQQVKELLSQCEQMKLELEELHKWVEKLKAVNQAVSILSEPLKMKANYGSASN